MWFFYCLFFANLFIIIIIIFILLKLQLESMTKDDLNVFLAYLKKKKKKTSAHGRNASNISSYWAI